MFPAFIGFGGSSSSQNPLSNIIDLTNEATNYSFIVPRDGTLEALSVLFSTTTSHNFVNTNVRIRAELYRGNTTNNIFTRIPESSITLSPAFSGVVPAGSVSFGEINNICINITKSSRLLLVISAEATGQLNVINIRGQVSAGLVIR